MILTCFVVFVGVRESRRCTLGCKFTLQIYGVIFFFHYVCWYLYECRDEWSPIDLQSHLEQALYVCVGKFKLNYTNNERKERNRLFVLFAVRDSQSSGKKERSFDPRVFQTIIFQNTRNYQVGYWPPKYPRLWVGPGNRPTN